MSKRIAISAIVVGERHRKDLGDPNALAEWIGKEGLLQPIGITEDRRLVFGERLKPKAFYDLIRRVTEGPRIDVFSRERHEGFDQCGDAVTSLGTPAPASEPRDPQLGLPDPIVPEPQIDDLPSPPEPLFTSSWDWVNATERLREPKRYGTDSES